MREREQKALIHEQWMALIAQSWSQTPRRIRSFILSGGNERRLSSSLVLGQKRESEQL